MRTCELSGRGGKEDSISFCLAGMVAGGFIVDMVVVVLVIPIMLLAVWTPCPDNFLLLATAMVENTN